MPAHLMSGCHMVPRANSGLVFTMKLKKAHFLFASLFRDKPKEKMGFCCLIFFSENNSVTFLMTRSTWERRKQLHCNIS